MPNPDLANLRRARIRCHKQLKQAEALVVGYREKLAALEAAIYAISPELELPLRTRRPNPHFRHGELSRMALAVLREAGEPLPVGVIAVRMLALKGVTLPDPATRLAVRRRIRVMFHSLDRRGVTMLVGKGRDSKRAIVGQ